MSNNEYMRLYMLERRKRRKAAAIKQLGGECSSCGSTGSLEFHHTDPNGKTLEIGSMLAGISEKRLQEELKKCVLLCESCHKKVSAAALAVEHGGGASGKKNCKCEPCRARKREYMKRYTGIEQDGTADDS